MDRKTKVLVEEHVGLDKWAQGKARAKQLVADSLAAEHKMTAVQWAWGDLSLEIVRFVPGGSRWAGTIIAAFECEYEFPYSHNTHKILRGTGYHWPKEKRSKAAFGVHLALKHLPNRFEIIRDDMTCNEALDIAGRRRSDASKNRSRASAIDCAKAAKSWVRCLRSRLDGLEEHPSDDVLSSISDAWHEITAIVNDLGIYDDLVGGEVLDLAI